MMQKTKFTIFVFRNICTYGIMSTGWVDGELNRIAFEMFARETTANVLVVETGALVILQARCRTVQA